MALSAQAIKSRKTKSTKDIPLIWNSLLFAELVILGFGISNKSIMIFASIEASFALSLLILKLLYK